MKNLRSAVDAYDEPLVPHQSEMCYECGDCTALHRKEKLVEGLVDVNFGPHNWTVHVIGDLLHGRHRDCSSVPFIHKTQGLSLDCALIDLNLGWHMSPFLVSKN